MTALVAIAAFALGLLAGLLLLDRLLGGREVRVEWVGV